MHKRPLKKLSLNKETLHGLEARDLEKAKGAAVPSWASDCGWTCGDDSCLGVCSLNCSWVCLPE